MRSPSFTRRSYAVLIRLSPSYPPLLGTFRCITHPFATRRQGCPRVTVRLACVKHAASVQSEPGSNSSVQSFLWQLTSPVSRPFRRCLVQPSQHLPINQPAEVSRKLSTKLDLDKVQICVSVIGYLELTMTQSTHQRCERLQPSNERCRACDAGWLPGGLDA